MENQSNLQRIIAIYQMLLEMATGNLTFRLSASGQDDELDKLSQVLNLLAADLQSLILKSGYVNQHFNYQNLVQTTFILNEEFTIVSFNTEACDKFHYTPEELFQMEFSKLIAPQSAVAWRELQLHAISNVDYHETIQLLFVTSQKTLLPAFCTVSRLIYSDKVLVSSVTTTLNKLISSVQQPSTIYKADEAAVIQKLYDYILNHLQDPLPTLKELSVLFDTSEYKLKDGFRELFKTSIYNFYHEERLKRAHLMIQATQIPLKEIAIMSGFNTYLNFYKAFKKRFAYTPTEVERTDKKAD